MNDVKRPLPNPDEYDTRDFWAATKEGKLIYQESDGTVIFYPRRHSTTSTDGEMEVKVASGRGKVYTYSIVRQSYHPFFRNLVPYAVAWIDLEEGPRILSNVIGVDDPVNDVKIGMDVVLEWEEHEKLSVPLFRPA